MENLMAKIAWKDVPAWAQAKIRATGKDSVTQVMSGDVTLSVVGGIATYNGKIVAAPGEVVDPEDNREETINLADLPAWARSTIRNSRGQCNIVNAGGALQLQRDGTARFNGKLVVKGKKSGFGWRWLRALSPF
jgi:hypothetical protein